MNKVTKSAIERLSQEKEGPVFSIYLPTHRYPTPPHMQEDQTRFKNLLHEARDKWHAKTDEKIDTIFAQLEAKLDEPHFWRETTEGMAIFASKHAYEIYHLPMESEEHVCVSESYDITPLVVLMEYDQPYYLLALAMHNSKIFRGDMYGLEPVAIDFPTSPEDALNIDEMFANSNTVRNQDAAGMSPHGAGDSNQAGTEERLQYFRIIDNIIASSALVDTKLPVLIAATDSEAGDYRQLSKLPGLIHTYIKGNYTSVSLPEIHTYAWSLIRQEVVDKRANEAVEQCAELEGVHKSSHNLKDIEAAAETGRVATLVIGMIRSTTDTVRDKIDTAVPILTFVKDHSAELLEQLTRTVLAKGGRIIGVGDQLAPAKVPVAAIYRY